MNRKRIAPASLIALLLVAAVARAEEARPLPSVSTTGTASVFVAPDRVDIRFRVEAFDKDIAKAKADVDAAATDVIQFLKAQGVPEAKIRSDYLTSEAIYQPLNSIGRVARGELAGYQVTRSYGVRLDELSKFPAVVDKLLSNPAIRVDGHAFGVKDERTHRDAARRQAARAAREKAELLAGELGRGVGLPLQIDERPGESEDPSNRVMLFSGGGDAPSPAAEATPVGQIEIRADVTVRFELINRG